MTSDPKAPGAAAVYLYREETTNNQSHYISEYVRIKILSEAGKEYATVHVPYSKAYTAVLGKDRNKSNGYSNGNSGVPIIDARTIHSDGTVIPLQGKAEDLLVFESHDANIHAAVFNMPSVEVGSILEYRWTIPLVGSGKWGNTPEEYEGTVSSQMASSVPAWEVQTPLYVHKAHFYFNPYTNLEQNDLDHDFIYYADGEIAHYLLFTANLPAGAHVNKSPKGDYALDIKDVPASLHEPEAPPESTFLYRVRFYYSPYPDSPTYWQNEITRWSKQVDSFAAQTDTIRQAADQITVGLATPDQKARKLYEAVQALDNSDFSREKTAAERQRLHLKREVKKAQDVWSEKSGDSNDMAALYLALARAAGLEAYASKVADRDRRIFDPNLLSLYQLDSLLVVLRIDNKEVFLDPGQKLCPFGQLAWKHSLAGGLQQGMKDPIFTPPNPSKDAISAHSADLTVDEHGAITGTIKILMSGPEALRWRQVNLTSDETETRQQFNDYLNRVLPQGIDGALDHFQAIDTSNSMLTAVLKVHGQLGTATGKRLFLPAFFFSTRSHKEFLSEPSRSIPVDLHYAEQVIDDVIYHLPAGFTIESAPPAAQFPWPEHAALVTKTTSAPGVIDIKHTFARAFVVLDPKDYPTLRDYYQKLATNDQQQLVLTSGSPSSGN